MDHFRGTARLDGSKYSRVDQVKFVERLSSPNFTRPTIKDWLIYKGAAESFFPNSVHKNISYRSICSCPIGLHASLIPLIPVPPEGIDRYVIKEMINHKLIHIVGCGQPCPVTPKFHENSQKCLDDMRCGVRLKIV